MDKYKAAINALVIDRNGDIFYRSMRPAKVHINMKGYPFINARVNGKMQSFLVHRLMAIKFIDNPDNKAEVNHKD